MNAARRWVLRFLLAWACSFAYLFITYYPVASISYAHHDQYRYFAPTGPDRQAAKAVRTTDPQWRWLRLIGRPVAAELEYQIFKRVTVVDDLTPIRVIGIGLYAMAMAIAICFLLELGLSAVVAFCLGGALFTLPAVQFSVYIASFNHPVAHILALTSAALIRLGSRVSADDPHWYRNPRRIVCHTVAIALLVVALLSYAPSAFVVLFPIAAEIAFKGIAGWPATRRHLIRDVFLTGLACIVYFAIIRHNFIAHGGHEFQSYKIEVNGDVTHRLLRIPLDLMLPALNLWSVHAKWRIAAVMACLLASGLGLALLREFRAVPRSKLRLVQSTWNCFLGRAVVQYTKYAQRFGRYLQLVAAITLILFFSEATYFAAPTTMSLYRMHFAFGGLIVLLFAGTAACWGRLIPTPWRHKAALALACVVLGSAGLRAHANVLKNCLNDRLELSFVSAQISAHAAEPIHRVHIIQPHATTYSFNGQRKVLTSEEFNVPTSDCPPSVAYMGCAAMLNVFDPDSFIAVTPLHTLEAISAVDPNSVAITYSAHGEPVIPSPGMIVIDMDQLLRVAAPSKLTALFGPATARNSAPSTAPRAY